MSDVPHASPPPGSPDEGEAFARALREALPPAALAAPARSPDDLVSQARALEGLGADAVGTDRRADARTSDARTSDARTSDAISCDAISCDLDLLHDLAAAEADVAAGRAAPLAPAVRLAALAARTSELVSTPPPAPRAPRTPAIVEGGCTTPASPVRASSPVRRRLASALVGLLLLGGYLGLRQAARDAERSDRRERAAAAKARAEREQGVAELARAAVLPTALFVDARLWRSLEGRAERGGAGLGLESAHLALGDGPDVVLAWRPDVISQEAATLRVHVRGPAGLTVSLPDLAVEAVLPGTMERPLADDVRAVDLTLPAGWGARLQDGELRLAFTWPRDATGPLPSQHREPVRFHGVALARADAPVARTTPGG